MPVNDASTAITIRTRVNVPRNAYSIGRPPEKCWETAVIRNGESSMSPSIPCNQTTNSCIGDILFVFIALSRVLSGTVVSSVLKSVIWKGIQYEKQYKEPILTGCKMRDSSTTGLRNQGVHP